MNKKNSRAFLRSALILTAALAVIIIFMNEWGLAQILITALVAVLAGAQWALWLYIKKTK